MASRGFSKALRAPVARRFSVSAVPRRSFVSGVAARPTVSTAARAAVAAPVTQQTRGLKTIDFAGTKETVYGAFITMILVMDKEESRLLI